MAHLSDFKVHQHRGEVRRVPDGFRMPDGSLADRYFASCDSCGVDPFPKDHLTEVEAQADLDRHIAGTGVYVNLG